MSTLDDSGDSLADEFKGLFTGEAAERPSDHRRRVLSAEELLSEEQFWDDGVPQVSGTLPISQHVDENDDGVPDDDGL